MEVIHQPISPENFNLTHYKDNKFSIVDNAKDTNPKKAETLKCIYEIIKGDTFKTLIEVIRAEPDEAKKKRLKANIGQTVRVAGWLENIRDHGGVMFLDIRDQYGVVQVVIHDENMLKGLNKECSLTVSGSAQTT